jgi:amino acid transporter
MTENTDRPRRLGAPHLLFFVVAAAAPLGFSLGAIPLGIGRGGVGLPLGMILAACILGLFAAGYVAMAGHLDHPGGLYSFVREGLGGAPGTGASFLALAIYAIAATGTVGAFAVFADSAANDLVGLDLPWWVWALFGTGAMASLGVLNIDLSAKVLGVMITLEVTILLVISFAVLFGGGSEAEGLTAAPFAPRVLLDGNVGTIFAVSLAAFAGFEATVLYSGDVLNRQRTIRRATIAALVGMALLYAFVSWAVIVAFGRAGAEAAATANPTTMFFVAAETYIGTWIVKVLEVLVVSSWFASILAFHNATARYGAAMGRDGIISRWFGTQSKRFGSPWHASLAHSGFTLAMVLLTIALAGDPYLDLYVLGSTPTVAGVPSLELAASIAVIAYFWRDRRGHRTVTVILAPALAALALAAIIAVLVDQLDLFTGRTGLVNFLLLAIPAGAFAVGCLRGVYLKRRAALPAAAVAATAD